MKNRQALKSFILRFISPEFGFFWFSAFLVTTLVIVDILNPRGIWVWLNAVVLVGIVVVIFWISHRLVATNLRAKTASGRSESIIKNLSDGVVVYNNDFKILIFNQSAEKIFDIKQDRVVGQYIGPERAKEKDIRLLVQTMFPSLAPTIVRRSEVNVYPQIVDISFGEQDFRVSTDRVLDDNGSVLGFVKLIEDRTYEIKLIKSKSEFIAIAAHQLRTPLSAINWVFEGLSGSKELGPEDKEFVSSGSAATKKLLKTVNDLLDVSRIEEGKFGYTFGTINIIDFVSEILTNAQVIAKKYGIKLYLDKGDDPEINLNIDPNRLALALSNLIDNAIKYNVKNGTITVRVEKLKDKPYVQISVRDTGVGIPVEDMDKIFSKFFRAENAIKHQTEGSGLGLYIAKNIIARHGGTIWVESVVGRGTTFYFILPVDPGLIPPVEVGAIK